jgi:predicted membrane protein
MAKKLWRIFLWITLVEATAFAVGHLISRKMTTGDENSNDFQVAAIFGGKRFHSHAGALKSGSAVATLGGMEIDLRDATIDPMGADLDVSATFGGMRVFVPEAWAVDVDADPQGGEIAVNVTPHEDLPEDAPRLRIHATAKAAGVAVTARN